MKSISFVLAGLLFVVAMTGCSGEKVDKGVTVKGKIQKGGQVLKPTGPAAPGASKVEIIFYPSDPNGVAEQAVADPSTGDFTLIGAGKGIKPGTYKVGVFVRGAGFDSDELAGKFNKDQTTISVSIPEDKLGSTHDIGAIDIDNPPKG